MQTEPVNPNIKNFVVSLRDIGYTFEIAVADIIDNSISAEASNIQIYTVAVPNKIFCLLDDGNGMDGAELVEAMRLASKNPHEIREATDLGRFGLGLKTASFSQCKRLTVVSKKESIVSAKQWDLDFISEKDAWLLVTPNEEYINNLPLVEQLLSQKSGTLVVWESIDKVQAADYSDLIDKLRKHLSLVFHRFLDGSERFKKFSITINNNPLKAFNPFNPTHQSTHEVSPEKISLYGSDITIQPFVLPHHSKLSQQEYERYATEDGYTKSQGFYLYRANRLLIYGTWWGLYRMTDSSNLVRIKIDIPNNQDHLWGIDIKKSTAKPIVELKSDLKRIIKQAIDVGSRPYTGRSRKIQDSTVKRFWNLIPTDNGFRFSISHEHPLYQELARQIPKEALDLFDIYLKGLQVYLPLEAIQAKLHQSPHELDQMSALTEAEIIKLAEIIKSSDVNQDYIEALLKTEIFKNRKELLDNEQ